MLEKLRRQFILIIMALVTLALAIMAGVVVFLNYQQLSSDVTSAVEYAVSDFAFEDRGGFVDGAAPDAFAPLGADIATSLDASASPDAAGTEALASAGTDTAPLDPGAAIDGSVPIPPADRGGRGGRGNKADRVVGADMVATSSYLVTAEGAVSSTLLDALELDDETVSAAVAAAVAAYDASELAAGAGSAQDAGAECLSGHLDEQGLYYSIRQTPNGLKAAFASDAYVSNSIGNLGAVLGIVSLCVWIAFLLVSIVLARWVVRPTQHAWAQQQQFVADASHELKTPLAVMMANNSILLSNPDETIESQRRWVESNQAEARQMLELVNDMLFLARPENAADRQQVMEDVNLSSLVEGNVLQFEAVCFERGVALSDEVDEGISVRGDRNRLQRLASTLIDNACKYADSRVNVKLSRTGSQVQLTITNDGATIPAEDLPHVFDRFYRVDKARVRSEGGVGLGLAIAQEVAREHGGEITVTSSDTAGTTFTATLPCQ